MIKKYYVICLGLSSKALKSSDFNRLASDRVYYCRSTYGRGGGLPAAFRPSRSHHRADTREGQLPGLHAGAASGIHTHVHTRTNTYTLPHASTSLPHTRTNMCIHVQTCTNMYIHVYTRTPYIHTCTYPCIKAPFCTHVHTSLHMYIHVRACTLHFHFTQHYTMT